jgi:hypothetical protein
LSHCLQLHTKKLNQTLKVLSHDSQLMVQLLVPIAMYTCNLNVQRFITIVLLMPTAMYTYNFNAQMFTQEIQLNYLLTLVTLVSE